MPNLWESLPHRHTVRTLVVEARVMTSRKKIRSKATDATPSTRGWLVDGIAWETHTTLVAIPALIVAGIATLLFDVSITMILVVAVGAALVIRLVLDGWRRLESADPDRTRTPDEDR
ncbi:MAG: hypothetical protein ABJ382_11010 [Ilumatobacter sp.]